MLNRDQKTVMKNSDKAKKYSDTTKRYLELGHAAKFNTTESVPTNNMTYYIPNHTSLTQTSNTNSGSLQILQKFAGIGLNGYLLKRTDLLNNLVTVLLRLRNRKYSLSIYIKNMFHQNFAKQNKRNSLRFLWRDSPDLVTDEC